MTLWEEYIGLIEKNKNRSDNDVIISVVGKYTDQPDAYLSLKKSLEIAAIHANRNLKMHLIDSSDLEKEELFESRLDILRSSHGVLVPGGFGSNGIEGKIKAIQFC